MKKKAVNVGKFAEKESMKMLMKGGMTDEFSMWINWKENTD
jgi:hypothetical protein